MRIRSKMAGIEARAAARVAEPVLARSLVADEEVEELVERVWSRRSFAEGVGERRGKIGANVKSLDDMIDGGLSSGEVVVVSSEVGAGVGRGVCLSYLVSSLLSDLNSIAAIIDTSGTVDVLRIYNLLLSRLQADAELRRTVTLGLSVGDLTVEELAAKALDKVQIMRVFDMIGAMEAMSEVRDELERDEKAPTKEKQVEISKKDDEELHENHELRRRTERTEVADSEEEDDDDEMLLDSGSPWEPTPPPVLAQDDKPSNSAKSQDDTEKLANSKISFILVDNLAHVVSPLLKKDYIQGNILASGFLRSLSLLTRKHSLTTIISNPATIPNLALPPPKPPSGPPQQHQPALYQQQPIPPPSIFASSKLVPAIMNQLSPFLDKSLMLSTLPRSKRDAQILAKEAVGTSRSTRGETVHVLEVLTDRYGGNVGNWGSFVVNGNGELKDV